MKPEKQNIKPLNRNEIPQEKSRIGQGRGGLRRRKPHINQPIAQSAEHSWKIPEEPKIEKVVVNMLNLTTPVQSISNPSMEMINRSIMQKIIKDFPFYPDPTYRSIAKPVRIPMSEVPGNIDVNLELNTDFEENCPFQEGVTSEMYQRPDKSFFPRTSRIGKFSQYRQASTEILT